MCQLSDVPRLPPPPCRILGIKEEKVNDFFFWGRILLGDVWFFSCPVTLMDRGVRNTLKPTHCLV